MKKQFQISHIVSTDLLPMIDFRDFYMCLANVASKDPKYLAFYKKKVEEGKFVLLDNGAAEKDQMTLDIMWDVIKEVNPSEVILNDSLLNNEETVEKSKEAYDFYKTKGYNNQFMIVPQGQDLNDWMNCKKALDSINYHTIGVSKFVTSGWNNALARLQCCEYLRRAGKQVHLLGCHININEVAFLKNKFNFIRSNDTAIAYIYAQSNNYILTGDRPEGEINFYQSNFNQSQKNILELNISIFDTICI